MKLFPCAVKPGLLLFLADELPALTAFLPPPDDGGPEVELHDMGVTDGAEGPSAAAPGAAVELEEHSTTRETDQNEATATAPSGASEAFEFLDSDGVVEGAKSERANQSGRQAETVESSGTEEETAEDEVTGAQATFNVFYFVEKTQSDQFPSTWPLNVESWLLHLRTKSIRPKVIQLNDANAKDYIPDLPNEFDSLPYAQAKSDFVRYAALFFHGGIYVDSDVLFQKPLDSEVPERIVNGGVELFAYESDGQNCMGDDKVRGGAPSFSSNIMGASKGSSYMRRVWEKQKQAVSDHCKTAAEFESEARICCPAPLSVPGAQMLYDKSDRPITKCHVPWARLGEGTSHEVRLVPAVEGFAATFRPTAVKAAHVTQFNPEGGRLVVCYRSDEHFAPFGANSLAAQIGSAEHDRLLEATPNALGRAAYHQGHSNGHPDIERRSCEELIDEKFVLGRILVQAFFGGGAVNKKIVERICERKDVGAEVLEGSTILNEVAPPAKQGQTAGAKEEAEQLSSVGQGEQLPLPEGEKAAEQASSGNEGLRGPTPKPKDGPLLKPSRAGRERSDRWAAKTGSIATQAAGSLVVVGVVLLVAFCLRTFWRSQSQTLAAGDAPLSSTTKLSVVPRRK